MLGSHPAEATLGTARDCWGSSRRDVAPSRLRCWHDTVAAVSATEWVQHVALFFELLRTSEGARARRDGRALYRPQRPRPAPGRTAIPRAVPRVRVAHRTGGSHSPRPPSAVAGCLPCRCRAPRAGIHAGHVWCRATIFHRDRQRGGERAYPRTSTPAHAVEAAKSLHPHPDANLVRTDVRDLDPPTPTALASGVHTRAHVDKLHSAQFSR